MWVYSECDPVSICVGRDPLGRFWIHAVLLPRVCKQLAVVCAGIRQCITAMLDAAFPGSNDRIVITYLGDRTSWLRLCL